MKKQKVHKWFAGGMLTRAQIKKMGGALSAFLLENSKLGLYRKKSK